MPIIHVNGAGLYYEEHGTGPETIVFAHALLWSCRMFDDQVAAFKDRYRAMPIMSGHKFLTDPARAAQPGHWRRRMSKNHHIGVTRATIGVIARRSIYDEIARIRVPTLVIVGDQDVAPVAAKAERVRERI